MHHLNHQKILMIVNSSTLTNSYGQSMTQSITDANDYVTKRGLNSSLRLAFDFGTTPTLDIEALGTTLLCQTAPYVGVPFFQAIAAAIDAWKLQGVICSTYCAKYALAALPSVNRGSLEFFAANAWYINANKSPTGTWNQATLNARIFHAPGDRNNYTNIINNTVRNWAAYQDDGSTNINNVHKVLVWGRIGCPWSDWQSPEIGENTLLGTVAVSNTGTLYSDVTKQYRIYYTSSASSVAGIVVGQRVRGLYIGEPTFVQSIGTDTGIYYVQLSRTHYFRSAASTTSAVSYYTASGTSIYTNAVTKALVAETHNNLDKNHVMSRYAVRYLPPPSTNAVAFDWASATNAGGATGGGLTNIYEVSYQGDGLAPYYVKQGGGGPDATPPSVDPSIPSIFSLCLNAVWNSGENSPLPNGDIHYFSDWCMANRFADGAWGYTWTSFSWIWANSILVNGGSAALCVFTEPFPGGLVMAEQVMVIAGYYGVSLMESLFLSTSANAGVPPSMTVMGDPLYSPYAVTAHADPVPPSPTNPAIDTHDGILMDKREEYARIAKEIERKNRKQYKKEQSERDRRKAELQEINEKYQRYLELREKYLKSRK